MPRRRSIKHACKGSLQNSCATPTYKRRVVSRNPCTRKPCNWRLRARYKNVEIRVSRFSSPQMRSYSDVDLHVRSYSSATRALLPLTANVIIAS